MLRSLLMVVFSVVLATTPAHSQVGFLLGMATGMALPGPDSSSSGGGSNVMFLANEEVRQGIDPLDVRTVTVEVCFSRESRQGHTVREAIDMAKSQMPARHRNSSRIIRVMFYFGATQCSHYVVNYVAP